MVGFEHFDLLAPIYDRFIQPPDINALVALLDLQPSDTVLDVGGGTGRIAKLLSDRVHAVVITDASLPMLRQAKGIEKLHLCSSFSERLPFRNASFRKIIMVDSLHHILDHQQTIAELWRVLAPDGLLVIEEPDIRQFRVKLLAVAEKLALFRSHFLSPDRISDVFKELGAEPETHADPPNVRVRVSKPA